MSAPTIPFLSRNQVPTPSTGQAILFYDIDNDNVLTAKYNCCDFYVLGDFPSLNTQVLDDALSSIVANITDKAACAMQKGVITASEFESITENLNMYSTVTVDPTTGSFTHGITTSPVLFIQFTKTNALGYGGTDGTASAVVTGGTAPYTLTWTTSAGALANNAALSAGSYKLTVVDSNGVTKVYSFVITEPPQLVLTVNVQNTSGGSDNGVASAVVTGGVAPYGYVWNDNLGTPIGQTTQTATGLAAGTYQVIVTDANGYTVSNLSVVIG
jgi:hypothetical protein